MVVLFCAVAPNAMFAVFIRMKAKLAFYGHYLYCEKYCSAVEPKKLDYALL